MVMTVTLANSPAPPEGDTILAQVVALHSGRREVLPRDWATTLSLSVKAPQSWWRQSQVYFPDILWLRAHPELDEERRRISAGDFEDPVPESMVLRLNDLIREGSRTTLNLLIPESFVRNGVIHTNVAVLRDILKERGHYQEGHWNVFCTRLKGLKELRPFISGDTRE